MVASQSKPNAAARRGMPPNPKEILIQSLRFFIATPS